jgi:hypothetical protein
MEIKKGAAWGGAHLSVGQIAPRLLEGKNETVMAFDDERTL